MMPGMRLLYPMLAASLLLSPGIAQAQSWPTKPVHWI